MEPKEKQITQALNKPTKTAYDLKGALLFAALTLALMLAVHIYTH